ncbi:MAG: ribose-5-phosphate isomerase RpiA [Anaerolineae bacterium]|nr:ribose-5-phosphate isomerase RpiA [Anaerolineae bacterium]
MTDIVAQLKEQAAVKAVELVEPGMVLGLGEGSTARFALQHIAQRLAEGKLHDIVAVPCSRWVEQEALALGIPLTTLSDHSVIDITIDGADEVDPQLNLIKGGGGALLREKIVAQATRRQIIIVDNSKLSPALGTRWAVPVAVARFGWQSQARYLEGLGARVNLRVDENGVPFVTDDGNLILDCNFGTIARPDELAHRIKERTGIVEHGLFVGLTTDLIVASANGINHISK